AVIDCWLWPVSSRAQTHPREPPSDAASVPQSEEQYRDVSTLDRSQPPGKTSAPCRSTITLSHAARRTTAGSPSPALARHMGNLQTDALRRAAIVLGWASAAHPHGVDQRLHCAAACRQRRGMEADQAAA